jgi:glycosyltransferase involved in cell wall biosynthesis
MSMITYVYAGGRLDKLTQNKDFPEDFFYGALHLKRLNYNVKIIEFKESKNILLRIIDKLFSKFFSLPFSTSKITSFKNLKIFFNSKNIVLVNENVGLSSLPLLMVIRIFKRQNISLFVMGLYSKKVKYSWLKTFHDLFIKLLIFNIDNVFFLGKGELKLAKKIHKNKSKLIYFPFAVDENYWKFKQIDFSANSNLLFVGNDGKRNPEIINELAMEFKNFNFKAVSNLTTFDKNIENLDVIEGNWKSQNVSDLQLKNIFLDSKIVLIPLRESTQPSGQSVALQSMHQGIPVMISKTNGFWDEDQFVDSKNIFFVEKNNLNGWIEKIYEVYNNPDLLKKVSLNAKKTCEDYFSLKQFNSKLINYIM